PAPARCTPRETPARSPRAPRTALSLLQAEDGIRSRNVTGVQTCALPISSLWQHVRRRGSLRIERTRARDRLRDGQYRPGNCRRRSEERRVGKEWSTRWSAAQGTESAAGETRGETGLLMERRQ